MVEIEKFSLSYGNSPKVLKDISLSMSIIQIQSI